MYCKIAKFGGFDFITEQANLRDKFCFIGNKVIVGGYSDGTDVLPLVMSTEYDVTPPVVGELIPGSGLLGSSTLTQGVNELYVDTSSVLNYNTEWKAAKANPIVDSSELSIPDESRWAGSEIYALVADDDGVITHVSEKVTLEGATGTFTGACFATALALIATSAF